MTKTITIGVLSPVPGGSYYGNVLAGIAREAGEVGGRVLLVQTLDAGLSSDEVLSSPDFATRTAWDYLDGVISISTATQRGYLERLQAAGKAVVLVSDQIEGLEAPSVKPDNSTGVTEAVLHLIGHGHTRIGFAANLIQTDMRERHDAYQAALLANGIDPDPNWFFSAPDNGELGGRDVARQVAAAGVPVTALILATDRNAIGCMARLADLRVAVPGDIAIVGFDGLEDGAYTQPTLSTVPQPHDAIGSSAARLLLAQLRGDEVDPLAERSSSTLLARGSCGCPEDERSLGDDGGDEFWHAEARMRFARAAHREKSMREQYEITMQLLDHERADPRSLEWLAATNVRGAYLALWDGDPASGRLRIAGIHDPTGVLPDVVGTICTIEQFPPASLVAMADPNVNEVTIVVPVKTRGLDFGLLAVAGEIDTTSENGRETHNQWAAWLTAALEQRNLVENVRTSEERYGLWAVATNDGLWDWDLATDTIYYSGRCMELLGHRYEHATAAPSTWFDAVHPDDLDRVRQVLGEAVRGQLEPAEFEHRIRGADGHYRCLSVRVLPVGARGDAAARLVGSISDVENRKQLEEQLRQGALYDEVTGLPNRKLFLERLRLAITDESAPPDLQYAVVFLDLDGFKLVNDSLGHLVGDRLLTQIGQRLRSGLRPADLAARFGGDEFAVLLHGVHPNAIRPIVERMQARLEAPMELDGHEVAVTASVGITTSQGAYTNAEDVLRDADLAMYEAKSRRRGSFALFDAEMRAGAVARLGLQSELRQAMDRKEFEVHYQPIVHLDGRGTEHFEALVRWQHPRRGLVLPMDFLPDMEETDLIVTLGRWIVDEICRQIARWQRSHDGTVSVSVNLSNRQFSDSRLVSHILECLRRFELEPANLTLEITERVVMRDPDLARVIIEELLAAGIGVQLDDFGTGTSSLQALRCLPIRALKIDRAFIHDLGVDPRTTKLVPIIVAMGQAIGVDVVAKGVETAAQLEQLRLMGCQHAQGFWFSEAVDAAAAAHLLGFSLLLPTR